MKKLKISGEDFLQILQTQSEIQGYSIADKITILRGADTAIVITDCDFYGDVFLESQPQLHEVQFVECVFNHRLVHKSFSSLEQLTLKQCRFVSHAIGVEIRGGQIILFEVFDCIFEGGLVCREQFQFESVYFRGCRCESIAMESGYISRYLEVSHVDSPQARLTLQNIRGNPAVQINDSTFQRLVSFTYSKIRSLHCHNVSCELRLRDVDVFGHCRLINICGNIALEECKILGESEIVGLSRRQEARPARLEIIACQFGDSMLIGHEEVKKRTNRPISIILKSNRKSGGDIHIKGLNIETLLLTGDSHHNLIDCQDIVAQQIGFSQFHNHHLTRFSFVQLGQPNGTIWIRESFLGGVEWFGIDLRTTDVFLTNSLITGMKMGSVYWPEKLAPIQNWAGASNPQTTPPFKSTTREAYRQIKLLHKNNGDYIGALRYKALEYEAYREELTESEVASWQDKLILVANLTNGHGLNWWRPLWMLVLTQVVLFLIMRSLMVISALDSPFALTALSVLSMPWAEVLFLLNPAHRLSDLLHGFPATSGIIVVDTLSRITASFFLFQMISAFRKYSR